MAIEHEISLVTRAQDLASGTFRNVGTEGERMGQRVATAMSRSDVSTGRFHTSLKAAGKGLSGLAVGLNIAAQAGGGATKELTALSNVVMGFAAGGPIVGAVNALAVAIGYVASNAIEAQLKVAAFQKSIANVHIKQEDKLLSLQDVNADMGVRLGAIREGGDPNQAARDAARQRLIDDAKQERAAKAKDISDFTSKYGAHPSNAEQAAYLAGMKRDEDLLSKKIDLLKENAKIEKQLRDEEAKRYANSIDAETKLIGLHGKALEDAKRAVERTQEYDKTFEKYGAKGVGALTRRWQTEDAQRKRDEQHSSYLPSVSGVAIQDPNDIDPNDPENLGLADARKARLNATHYTKRRRALVNRQRMGRSIHDGRFSGLGGIRSGRRLDQMGDWNQEDGDQRLDGFSEWYGGAGDMGLGTPPRRGGTTPSDHGAPKAPGAVTPGDNSLTQAAQSLGDSAGAAKDGADAAKKVADNAEKLSQSAGEQKAALQSVDQGIGKAADSMTDLTGIVTTLGTNVSSAITRMGSAVTTLQGKVDDIVRQLQDAAKLGK
jgi:hypothetical protein